VPQPQEAQAQSDPQVPLSAVQAMIDKAVAAAMSARIHQHTPIGTVLGNEMSGRTREEGTLVVSKLDETKGYVEYGFNDGTVRRDYK
jgi:fructose-1,6-bisphosphatase/inositol monophosphatase family enzyme